MAFNKSGVLVEGIRLANANNPFNYPPRNFVTNSTVFNSQINRSEYNIITGSFNNFLKGADIAHPDLRFFWTKNEGTVFRFSYDSFAQKWLPAPGSIPDELGVISNENRLNAPVPDISISDAPVVLYIGAEIRVNTFSISYVGNEVDFSSNPGKGIVELAIDSGLLNFDPLDIAEYEGQSVFSQRQSFFDRTKVTGQIGVLPISSVTDYFIYMNPLPATGQLPRIRINYQRHLLPIEVPNDNGLDGATQGTFHWSATSGRVKFSTVDIDTFGGRNVYYDGVYNSVVSLSTTVFGTLSLLFPTAAFQNDSFIGLTDSTRFLVFAELNGVRSYFPATIFSTSDFPNSQPISKNCYINSTTGGVYFNSKDIAGFAGWTFKFIDTIVLIDNGVSVQFFRSSVNGSGLSLVNDFTIIYYVEDQIVVDGIGEFPFAQLPTVPVVDNDLIYKVVQGPSSSGSFTGELIDGTDPTSFGRGYFLNLDQKQIQFSNRKLSKLTLPTSTPSVKLDDGIISPFGFEITKNGASITAGIDFILDATTGELLFLESVGGSSENNRFGIDGVISLPSIFTSSGASQFNVQDIGRVALVQTGGNTGVYDIRSLINDESIFVSPDFLSAGNESIDIKETAEIIADNFWVPLELELRKFTLSKGSSITGSFTEMDKSEFGVFASNGQVNLVAKTDPGDVYQISYSYLETQDDGSSLSVSATELASFKIRQEQAITVIGSNIVTFNPAGNTVNTNQDIEVYLNGVTQTPETFEFIAPGTLSLQQPIQSGQTVILNYYVNEATGGESNFILVNSPLDIDKIHIGNGDSSVVINGNWGDVIFPGTVLKSVEDNAVTVVASMIYNTAADTTTLTFESPSNFDSGTSNFFYSSSSIFNNRVTESTTVDIVTNNSTNMSISGDVSTAYREGTIVTLDGDPIAINSSLYDSITNVTTITFSVRTKSNYIDPVIRRSASPIFNSGVNFQTSYQANVNQEFILVKMGQERKILVPNVDYKVTEGGSIIMTNPVGGTDILRAIYVANDFQPVGTEFDLNYAYAIVPNNSNGISGQRLLSTYNLYSPDCYFYRVETVETFLPEVQDYLRESSQSSGVSGPNTNDAVGRSNKDEGSPSPYFNEQHYYNLDYTIIQLLKFYNDVINLYEDILSNIDGRIVGGEHGRFRFDGLIDNPPRSSYSSITNDIDDQIKLYDAHQLTGFFSFSLLPVYRSMAQPNSLSRIFPTAQESNVAINDQVGFSNFGKTLGTIGTESLNEVGNFVSAQAVSFFDAANSTSTFTTFTIDQNGDIDNIVPAFASGQLVTVYTNSGIPTVTAAVVVATNTSITINSSTTVASGSIVRSVSDENDDSVSRYTTGFDIGVKEETGEVRNITLPLGITKDIAGNEILNVSYNFNNSSIDPKRIPALDGSILNDYGYMSAPPLRREGENILFAKEAAHYARVSTGSVQASNLNVITTTLVATVGDKFKFLNGPNAGEVRTISSVVATGIYVISFPLFNATSNASIQRLLSDGSDITTDLNSEIGILSTNVANNIGNVPVINSELQIAGSLIECLGDQIASGTGSSTSMNTFTDLSATFTLDGVDSQSYLYVINGPNYGLYHVISATSTQLTIENNSSNPGTVWSNFQSVGSSGNYAVFNVEPFLSSAGPEFLTVFIQKTNAFLNSTIAWLGNVSLGGIPSRQTSIVNRQADTAAFIEEIETILQRSEALYDIRYLWIQQRTNREDGLLTQTTRSINQRIKDIKKLQENQRKLLIVNSL